jgi:hypothetical protein
MFYQSQFINCNTAFSMIATRANNLNAWVDCKFDGGGIALKLASQNATIVAKCDFTNYTGSNVITTNSISMYSSSFTIIVLHLLLSGQEQILKDVLFRFKQYV